MTTCLFSLNIIFCVACFAHNLIPFINQALIEQVLEVLESQIYIGLYLLLGICKVLLVLLVIGTHARVELILLLLEVVEQHLRNLLLLQEVVFLEE